MSSEARDLSPDIVLQCVDLRRRLRQTEISLQGLTALEYGVPISDDEDMRRIQGQRRSADHSRGTSPRTVPLLTMDDLSPRELEQQQQQNPSLNASVSSSLGSLHAFRTPTLPSSTPKQQTTRSRITPDSLRGSYSAEPSSVVRDEVLRLQEEKKLLKERIVGLQDENSHLMAQVQSKTRDIEMKNLEGKRMSEKIRLLASEIGQYRKSFPDLEERVISLSAETKAQDDALRKAEERCEETHRLLAQAETKLAKLGEEHENCTIELQEERKLRKRMESQRDIAVEELNQLQGLLSAYQRKSKDKITKLEETEDHLRDSLSHANQEREDLLGRMSSLQEQLAEVEEEYRILKEVTDLDIDRKSSLEEEITKLKSALDSKSQELAILKSRAPEQEELRTENERLKCRLESQESQLVTCQEEINESRFMLDELERLVLHLQKSQGKTRRSPRNSDDSGVGSILSDGIKGRRSSPSNQGSRSSNENSGVMSKFTSKMAEILQLQTTNPSDSGSSKKNILGTLRSELLEMVENAEHCKRKVDQVQSLLNQMDSERTQLNREVDEARREAADRETICSSLESRLKQTEKQLSELQDEVLQRSATARNHERELRKKSAQITSLEEQLDEKIGEYTMHMSRLKLQEDDLAGKMEEIHDLRTELSQKDKRLKEMTSATGTVRRVQQEQFQEFEKQIDILQEELEKKMEETKDLTSDLEQLNSDLSSKDTQLATLTEELTRAQKELTEKRSVEKKMFTELESQTTLATNQIKQLESSLTTCREEMGSYIKQLDKSKHQFDKDINSKNKQISVLDKELKEAYLEVEAKSQKVIELEASVRDQQIMLEQSSGRIGELEDSQSRLQTQIAQLEQKLLREKGHWVEESKSLKRKLQGACHELGTRATQLSELTDALQALQTEKLKLEKELKSVDKELTGTQHDIERLNKKMSQVEKENRDLRVIAEEKSEMIQDLEEQIKYKDDTLEQHNEKMVEKEQRYEDLKAEVKLHKARTAEARDELQKSQFECKAKERLVEDMRESLRRTQESMSESQERIRELEKSLEERLWELHQRAAQVSKLETTIKEYQERVEETTGKQRDEIDTLQDDLRERNKQISDLDDKLQETQRDLTEATRQLQHSEQTIGRLENELRERANELTGKQKQLHNLQSTQDHQKEDLAETTQELRLAREQLQQQNGELRLLKQEVKEVERERDRLTRELEKSSRSSQDHESLTENLRREIDALEQKDKLSEMRLTSESTRHQQEIDRMNSLHQEELSKLQESYAKLLTSNEQLSTQTRLQEKSAQENKQQTEVEITSAQNQIKQLEKELETKLALLNSLQETGVLKDSEIARLQARIYRVERDVGMRAAEQWMSTRDSMTASSVYSDDMARQNVDGTAAFANQEPARLRNLPNVNDHHQQRFYGNEVPNRDVQFFAPEPRDSVRGTSNQDRPADLKTFETSESESDRGMCRRFATNFSENDQSVQIPLRMSKSDTKINITSPKSQKLVRTLTFEDSFSDNANNSNISMSKEHYDEFLKPQSELRQKDAPLKSALKNGRLTAKEIVNPQPQYPASRWPTEHQQNNSTTRNKSANNKHPSQRTNKQSLGTVSGDFGNSASANKRLSQDFQVHDFEDTVTAMQRYKTPNARESINEFTSSFVHQSMVNTADVDPLLSVEDLQDQLRANELKQQEIDRQLLSLESEFEVSQDIDISQ